MNLPKGLSLSLMQTKWASILDPFLGSPSLDSLILPPTLLSTGANTINHTLGRKLQGWRIVRINGVSQIYDQQDSNSMTNLTLLLVSSAPVTVTLEVF